MNPSERMKALSEALRNNIEGDILTDELSRNIYATDASVYKELPLIVAYPKHKKDIQEIVKLAGSYDTPVIPRSGGTSLAGQCVGSGIILDVSRYMCGILEVDETDRWARVQPGVIRDELNFILKEKNLFFGPNTSTANRAMIGGMAGNNSSGSYSLVYGTTRDHVIELEMVLQDGNLYRFKNIDLESFNEKCNQSDFEGELYRHIHKLLTDENTKELISRVFPKKSIHRRNSGYALDTLLDSAPFGGKEPFNFCKLLCGTEGTLGIITEIKVNLSPLPPPCSVLIGVHFESIQSALDSVIMILGHKPRAVELMDKIILDCTKENIAQQSNRFFIKGDPEAILLIEFADETDNLVDEAGRALITELTENEIGYHYAVLKNENIHKAWTLRAAGLGVLSNIKGDSKPVAVVEDTAVDPTDLSAYIAEFSKLMHLYGQKAVYYAHAGAGELHLRPILNLKEKSDVKKFRDIARDSALLVKKYNGSLSGEHGDGRVRSEFIETVMGKEAVTLFESVKDTWDPKGIFNPGKKVRPVKMDENLRYESGEATKEINTKLSFEESGGFLRAVEKCNGSGDCRKLALSGGTMCPSYMASRNEKDTTRARANALRQYLTKSKKENPFDEKDLMEVLDLCISCKGCSSECPSNVDMASMKAEFLHQYYLTNPIPFRSRLFASLNSINKTATHFSGLSNWMMNNSPFSKGIKNMLGISPGRKLPELSGNDLVKWWKKNKSKYAPKAKKGTVYFFTDEFTRFNDTNIGQKAILLISALGYEVVIPEHEESGRIHISKGFLDRAAILAEKNVKVFSEFISENSPLIGTEPSAIFTFRDEYPKLVKASMVKDAKKIKANTFTVEEWLSGLLIEQKDLSKLFKPQKGFTYHYHGHCHEKSLSQKGLTPTLFQSLLEVNLFNIPSGCCGMAGSFGYEKEHYEFSEKIAELVLLPYIRKLSEQDIILASGTSCRHQIRDFTERVALHPVEVLFEALKEKPEF
ncbi:MAG: FAD-binding oxidoreductase [Chitinophagaceae bacterium]|nr:MAG: FAD-binding oxidoreductase [Chitinophagaceae bacterium]